MTILRPFARRAFVVAATLTSVVSLGTVTGVASAVEGEETTTTSVEINTQLIAVIDQLIAKVKKSSLDEATKQQIYVQLKQAREAVKSGAVDSETMRLVLSQAQQLLENQPAVTTSVKPKPPVTDPSKPEGETPKPTVKPTEKPEDDESPETSAEDPSDAVEEARRGLARAVAAIDANIAKIEGADVPADVKAAALDALREVRARLVASESAGSPRPADVAEVKERIADKKATRLAEMVQRLSALADKIETLANEAEAQPDSAGTVAVARANVAQAREALKLVTSPSELRAVFGLLKDAKLGLNAVAG